jgi:putative chitinase
MGKYFTIAELTNSATAKAKKIDNTPNAEQTKNLEELIKTLDIIREHFGSPITITSGFRSWQLNSAVGGSKTSHHARGMASDMVCKDNKALFDLIIKLKDQKIIAFTQLINEKPLKDGTPSWVHLGVDPKDLKNQILTIK